MLPAVRTDAEWQAVVWDEKIVRPAAEDLAARLGLPGSAGTAAMPLCSSVLTRDGVRWWLQLRVQVKALLYGLGRLCGRRTTTEMVE